MFGVTHQFNERWQSHFLFATGLQWACDHFLANKGDSTDWGGGCNLRKVFLLHKNGSSTAFPSLSACTVTSEDVLSGAVAATLQSRGEKPGERSQHAYDGRQQAQKELGSLVR